MDNETVIINGQEFVVHCACTGAVWDDNWWSIQDPQSEEVVNHCPDDILGGIGTMKCPTCEYNRWIYTTGKFMAEAYANKVQESISE